MKHKIEILKQSIVVILLFVTFSCEDHLKEELSTSLDQSYLYNNVDGLHAGIVGLYNFNRSLYHNSNHEWFSTLMLQSRGELTVPRAGVISLFGKYEWGVSPDGYQAGLVGYWWRLYYKIANKATSLIDAAENIEDIDEDERKQIIAEAKFFRANSYFILYRMFNNVFVTETPITPQNAFDIINNRSTNDEIIGLLERDLDYATEHLKWTTTQFGRVTKGTAKHVRAKVAMWKGDWQKAKEESESVINSSPHSLVGSTSQVFNGDLNNSEQLFVIQYADGVNGEGNRNLVNWNLIPWYYQMQGSTKREEYGGRGFAFLLPNNYLLSLLAQDPNDDRDNNNYFRLTYHYNDAGNLPPGKNVGDVIDIYQPTTDPISPSPTNARYYRHLHPSCLKFKQEGADPLVATQKSNVMVYRLAETYLIAAEANMRINGSGLSFLNTLRARAHAAPLGTINQQIILDERARELSFEGQRWYTLKRMGISTMRTQIQTFAGDDYYQNQARTQFQDHFINFPIPRTELDFLGPNYPQNTGY